MTDHYHHKPRPVTRDDRVRWALDELLAACRRLARQPDDPAYKAAVVGRTREWEAAQALTPDELAKARAAKAARERRTPKTSRRHPPKWGL